MKGARFRSRGSQGQARVLHFARRARAIQRNLLKVVRGPEARIGRSHQSQGAACAPGPGLGPELADHDDRTGRDQRMDASRPGILAQRVVPVCIDPAAGPQRRHSTRRNMAAYRRGLHVQRRRFRAVQLVCLARLFHLAGGDRQLFHADLGEPDGLADPRRAPEHQSGSRVGAVHQRIDRADLSGGDGAICGRAAACALLRAQLGRRHGLHEMGAHRR